MFSAEWIYNENARKPTSNELDEYLNVFKACAEHSSTCRAEDNTNIGCIPKQLSFMCDSYNEDLCSPVNYNEPGTCVCCSK